MSSSNSVGADRLKSFIHRVERLNEEIKAIMQDRRDVFSEAKGVGYDVKTMRKVIALRAMDAADRAEQETLIDTYMHALETIDRVEARVASGESIRRAAAEEGMPKSTAIRQVTQNRRNVENGSGDCRGVTMPADEPNGPSALSSSAEAPRGDEDSTTPHDPKTGEITPEQERPEQQSPVGQAAPFEDSNSPGGPAAVDNPGGDHDTGHLIHAEPAEVARDAPPADAAPVKSLYQRITGAFHDPTRAPENIVGLDPKPMPKADSRTFDEIAGPLPDRLRRERVRA